MEGQRVPREIPGIVDHRHHHGLDRFRRRQAGPRFVCTCPNPWGYPAKDRSGKLEQIEPPDLGELIAKILPPRASHQGGGETQADVIP